MAQASDLPEIPPACEGIEAAAFRPAESRSARTVAQLKKLGRFLSDCLHAVLQGDLGDRINEFPEYRKARMQALQDTMLRGINR